MSLVSRSDESGLIVWRSRWLAVRLTVTRGAHADCHSLKRLFGEKLRDESKEIVKFFVEVESFDSKLSAVNGASLFCARPRQPKELKEPEEIEELRL